MPLQGYRQDQVDDSVPTSRLLLKGATVLHPDRGREEVADVLIDDGVVQEIGNVDEASFGGTVIDCSGKVIAPGFIDMHVHLREPGREDEETVISGCRAAMAGGFTAVCPMPNTDPPADSREVIDFLKERSQPLLVDVFPIAAATKGRRGEELTEMAELVDAGAVAFSDDGSPIATAELVRRAMEYSSMFGVPIIEHCEDPTLSRGGVMNESVMSTRLGLTGIPSISEDVCVARDILVAEFTGARLHIAHISTAGAVELVRQAKKRGIQVTAEVTPHHFTLNDEALESYDTNLKMNPPLRAAKDVEAIREGLRDGTIDVIATDHAPHSIEEKEVEFDAAPFGITGLETAFGLIVRELVDTGVLTLMEAVQKITVNPARILSLGERSLRRGAPANLVVFDPAKSWTFDKKRSRSKSKNTPFHGWKLKGAILAVYNRGRWWKAADW
jgi:dihydroorotase